MKQRVITSVVGLLIFLPLLIFGNTRVTEAVYAILSTAACLEILHCAGCLKKWFLSLPLLAFAAVFPFLSGFSPDGKLWTITALLVLTVLSPVFSNGAVTAQDAGASLAAVLFCTLCFSAVPPLREKIGVWFYLIYVAAWGSDTFAYLSGKAFGKHKLIPKISPRKTVEGAIGGVLAGAVLSTLFGLVWSLVTHTAVDYPFLLGLGALAALVSQLGDLILSAFKRSYGVKDFGKIFPGHGGVLDRFDSTLPVALLLCLFASHFA